MLEMVFEELSKVITAGLADQNTPDPEIPGDGAPRNDNAGSNGPQNNEGPGGDAEPGSDQPDIVEPQGNLQSSNNDQPGNSEPTTHAQLGTNDSRDAQTHVVQAPEVHIFECSEGNTLVSETSLAGSPVVRPVTIPGNEDLDSVLLDDVSRMARLEMRECFFDQMQGALLKRMGDESRNFAKHQQEEEYKKAQRAKKKKHILDHQANRGEKLRTALLFFFVCLFVRCVWFMRSQCSCCNRRQDSASSEPDNPMELDSIQGQSPAPLDHPEEELGNESNPVDEPTPGHAQTAANLPGNGLQPKTAQVEDEDTPSLLQEDHGSSTAVQAYPRGYAACGMMSNVADIVEALRRQLESFHKRSHYRQVTYTAGKILQRLDAMRKKVSGGQVANDSDLVDAQEKAERGECVAVSWRQSVAQVERRSRGWSDADSD